MKPHFIIVVDVVVVIVVIVNNGQAPVAKKMKMVSMMSQVIGGTPTYECIHMYVCMSECGQCNTTATMMQMHGCYCKRRRRSSKAQLELFSHMWCKSTGISVFLVFFLE